MGGPFSLAVAWGMFCARSRAMELVRVRCSDDREHCCRRMPWTRGHQFTATVPGIGIGLFALPRSAGAQFRICGSGDTPDMES